MPPRRCRSWPVPIALGALLGTGSSGCTSDAPAPTPTAEPAAPAEASVPAEDAVPVEAQKPPPLSEEDLALLAADPKDLTREQRRKRAYARRRQIMQNPDSPVARALQDLADAHRAGEIDAKPREGVWFSLPGTKPTHGRPPAGWRPPKDEGEGAAPASPTSAGSTPSPNPADPSNAAGSTPAPTPNAPSTP